MNHLVGLDIGTSNTKAVAYSLDGHVLARASHPTPVRDLGNRRAIYNPDQLWNAVVRVLRDIATQIPESIATGICVASIGESGIPLDRHGTPCYPSIAWYDERSLPQAAWWEDKMGKPWVFQNTGLSLSHIYSLNKLLWLRTNEPAIFNSIERWLCISDYIAYRLCKEQAMGYSLASRTMAFDLLKASWSHEILSIAGVSETIWPHPLQEGSLLGQVDVEIAKMTGLSDTTSVVVGGHDHVVAALAVGATKPGIMIDSTGTTETEMVTLGNIHKALEAENCSFCLGRHVVENRFYAIAGILGAGSMIQWMGSLLYGSSKSREENIAMLTDAAQKSPVGARGLWILPHMAGRGAPNRDEASKAVIAGLGLEHSHADLARATIEGLAYELDNLWESLENFTGQQTLRTISVGGGAQNDLWMQIKADVTGRLLDVAKEPEAVAKGAAILAGLGTGVWQNADDAINDWHCETSTTRPDAKTSTQYAQLRSALLGLRPMAHALEQGAKMLRHHAQAD